VSVDIIIGLANTTLIQQTEHAAMLWAPRSSIRLASSRVYLKC
jgi:hypothetical protein